MKILFAIILSFGFCKAYGYVGKKIQKESFNKNSQRFGAKTYQVAGENGPAPQFITAQSLMEDIEKSSTTISSATRGELTWDMIDRLLTAEAALKSNDLNFALEKYMEVAKETLDSSVSARALELALLARNTGGKDLVAQAAILLSQQADPLNVRASQILPTLLIHSGNVQGAVYHLKFIVETMSNHSRLNTGSEFNETPLPLPNLEEKFDGFQQGRFSLDNVIGSGFDFAIQTLSQLFKGEHRETAFNTARQLANEYGKENIEAQMALAWFLALGGQTNEALDVVESIAPFFSGNADVTIFQSDLYQKNKENEKAIEVLEQFLNRYPNSEQARISYAYSLIATKKYKTTEEYRELVRRNPENETNRYFFGLALLYTDQLRGARQQFEKLLESDNQLFQDLANYSLGLIAESKTQYNEAMVFYNSVKGEDFFINAQVKIAGVMTKKGDLQAGRTHLQNLKPKNFEEHSIILGAEADMLINVGEYEEMKAMYQRVFFNYPSLAVIEIYIKSADKIGQLDMVFLEDSFKTLLNANPNDANILNYFGYLLIEETNRYEEAYEIILFALQLSPNSPHILDSMGWVLFRLERYEEALEYLEEAKSMIFPDSSPEIEAHIGEVYWTMGNKEKARRIWNEALDKAKGLSGEEYLIKTMERLDPNGKEATQ